jgi:uncharacterized protein (DUF58 family)
VVFLLSDFIDEGYERVLSIASRKHDLNVVRISDPRERYLPDVGLIALRDSESGRVKVVDTSSAEVRKQWTHGWERRRRLVDELCGRVGAGRVDVSTADDYVGAIVGFFARRKHERGISA